MEITTQIFNNITGMSKSGDTVIAPTGKYIIEVKCDSNNAGLTRLRLWNDTNAVVIAYGKNSTGSTASDDTGVATLFAIFEITAQKTLSFDLYTYNGSSTMGLAQSNGTVEIYAQFIFTKINY